MTTSSNEKFNQTIDEIILELQNLKKINEEKNLEFIKENEIIQFFLKMIQQEVSQKDLHPNKNLHISNLINSIKLPTEKQSISEDFNVDEERFSELLKLKQNVQNLKEMKFTITVNAKNNIETHYNSNLIKILQSESPVVTIEEKTFSANFWKSNHSCFFTINEESFLAWTGFSLHEEFKSPLIVYNLSQMKREASLPNENHAVLNFISVFPKNETEGYLGKKILYCGDNKGVLRIYDIDIDDKGKKTNFQLKSILECKEDEIYSAVIFVDKFREIISQHEKVLDVKNDIQGDVLYVMIATNNKSILLYKKMINDFHTENWVLHKKIEHPFKFICTTMAYFHDEELKKTRFFFGFTNECISIYDFKGNNWEKTEFETRSYVSSMNFILKKTEYFLVYTQLEYYSIIVGNSKSGKVVRKVDLENVTHIHDCYVWNDGYREKSGSDSILNNTYLIASCWGTPHSIVILDFENLNVLFVKNMSQNPVNSIKTLRKIRKNNKEEEYQDGLACFMGNSISSEIVLYENMEF